MEEIRLDVFGYYALLHNANLSTDITLTEGGIFILSKKSPQGILEIPNKKFVAMVTISVIEKYEVRKNFHPILDGDFFEIRLTPGDGFCILIKEHPGGVFPQIQQVIDFVYHGKNSF